MALGIKRDYLSFEILPNLDSKTMLFLDTSDYKEEPERPLLEVTLPGHTRYTLVNIIHNKVNVLNSNLTGYSKLLNVSHLVDLPDGVWTLKYKICPYDKIYVQKYHLRTNHLDCKMRQIHQFIQHSDCVIADDEKIKKEVVDLMLLIETGKAEAEEGNAKRAGDLYQKALKRATRLLEKLNGKC